MIGLDTNVLIRHITQDDPVQSPVSTEILERRFTEQQPGFLSVATILETVWVLESFYGLAAQEIATTIQATLQLATIVIQNEREIFLALHWFRSGKASFTDALMGELGLAAGCDFTFTFDRKAARLPGFRLIA
jgi:predicted nucleic-acid-binding protein